MMKPVWPSPTRRAANRRRRFTSACAGLLAACVTLALVTAANAQFDYEGGVIKTKDVGDGSLSINYFNEQSANGTAGCLHVEVSNPARVSSRDRNLEIVFYANYVRGGPRDGSAYRFPVRLPEGAQRVEVSLPYVSPGQSTQPGNQILVTFWDVGVLEDGRDVEALRTYNGSRSHVAPVTMPPGKRAAYHVMTSNGAAVSVLRLIDDNTATNALQPEMFRLLTASAGQVNDPLTSSLVSKTNFGLSSDSQNVGNIRALSTAPDNWLYYLQFNLVVFDEALLKSMRETQPGVNEALKQYISAGGSVLFLGSDRRAEELIDQWLNESAVTQSDGPAASRRGEWQRITAPVEPWWNRGTVVAFPAVNGVSMQSVATSTLGTVVAGYNTGPYGMNSQPMTDRSEMKRPANDIESAPSQSAPASAPAIVGLTQGEARNEPLSVGGAARDVLTLAQTYWMAEYDTPLGVTQSLIDMVEGSSGMSAAAGMQPYVMTPTYGTTPPYGTTSTYGAMPTSGPIPTYGTAQTYAMSSSGANYSPLAIELYELFEPLQAALEDSVVELQRDDPVGCSVRDYGLGQAGVVRPRIDALPVEAVQHLAARLNNSASLRINSSQDSAWTWRNLIRSVGKPPIWTFCAFVLLFGLLLGPGLLIFTGWMGRRSLLIFLVPALSLIATISIAAYEVLHEGFDTYIRISSLVTIDQPTGRGFAWSRQTYFSGWPPREGLRFPNDVYYRSVIAVQDFMPNELTEPRRSVGNRIHIDKAGSQWTGWLNARQQQQLLIGNPVHVSAPLQVTPVDARHLKLKNLTESSLPFAVARDGADGYYLALDLTPGAEVECQSQTSYEVGIELSRIRGKHLPNSPPELQAGGWSLGRRYVTYPTDHSFNEVLDAAWLRYMTEFLVLPRYGFVTLQETSDAVYVPLKGNITESKHLVVGRLVW